MTAQPTATSPLERPTLAEMIAERIKESITNGTLAPGTRLSGAELATTFGVSRAPVQEAIQRLIHEGLLRNGPGHRAVVPVLSHHDVRDIYLARAAVESTAVEHIIATADLGGVADPLERLVTLMTEAEAADDWQALSRWEMEFHTALVAATGSPRLQRMFNTVILETRLCRGALTPSAARDDLVDQHRQIATLIRDGKNSHAQAALKKYFDNAIKTYSDRHRTGEEKP